MKKNGGSIVYWINKSCEVQSDIIKPEALKGGATYVSESFGVTDDAEYYRVVPVDQADQPMRKEELERLKQKAEEMKMAQHNPLRQA